MFRIRYFLSKKNIFTIRPIDTAIYIWMPNKRHCELQESENTKQIL